MLKHEEVKRRREALKLSLPEAAQRGELKGDGQAWWNVENARVSDIRLSTLLALARGLKCSIADLVSEDYPPARGKRRDRRSTQQ